MSQTKFDQMGLTAIHIPLSILVLHQSALVSVTWLPPVGSHKPFIAGETTLMGHLVGRLKASVGLTEHDEFSLCLAEDARCYIVGFEALLGPSQVYRGELLSRVERVPVNLNAFLEREVVPQAARNIAKDCSALRTGVTVPEIVKARHYNSMLHRNGLNVALGFQLIQSPFFISELGNLETVKQAFVTEMAGRCLKHLLLALIQNAAVPESSPSEIQSNQRIIVANTLLDRLANSRVTFFTDTLIPMLKIKFALPPEFSVFSASLSVITMLDMVRRMVGVDFDGTGRLIARFRPPHTISHSAFECPDALTNLLDLNLNAANTLVNDRWQFAATLTSGTARWYATRLTALHWAYLIRGQMQEDFASQLVTDLEMQEMSDPAACCLNSGFLAQFSTKTRTIGTLCQSHAKQMAFYSSDVDKPIVAERFRVLGKLSATLRDEATTVDYFSAAIRGYESLLPEAAFRRAIVVFDVLMHRASTSVRLEGPIAAVTNGHISSLMEAAAAPVADKISRQEQVASLLQLLTTAVKTDGSVTQAFIDATAASLRLHRDLYGVSDVRTAAVMYHHLFVLIATRMDAVHSLPLEISTNVSRFGVAVGELTKLDTSGQEMLVNSEWMISTCGTLIAVAMDEGFWEGATAVLDCAKERYATAAEGSIARMSLVAPLERLERANKEAKRIVQFWLRATRRKWNVRLGYDETLHRAAILYSEEMRRRYLVWLQARDQFGHLEVKLLLIGETGQRFPIYMQERQEMLKNMEVYERDFRKHLYQERFVWLDKMLDMQERLHRRQIFLERGIEAAINLDHIHMAYRERVEMMQRRAYNGLCESLETMHRVSIILEEQMAVRALWFLASSRTLQRILQNEVLLLVVPVLSVYFFNEEQYARDIVAEEWATAVEELRLKESIFRVGAFRKERLRHQVERNRQRRGGPENVDTSPKRRASPTKGEEAKKDSKTTKERPTNEKMKPRPENDDSGWDYVRLDPRVTASKKADEQPQDGKKELGPVRAPRQRNDGLTKQTMEKYVASAKPLEEQIRRMWTEMKDAEKRQTMQSPKKRSPSPPAPKPRGGPPSPTPPRKLPSLK